MARAGPIQWRIRGTTAADKRTLRLAAMGQQRLPDAAQSGGKNGKNLGENGRLLKLNPLGELGFRADSLYPLQYLPMPNGAFQRVTMATPWI